jgi:hypothetical protein
MKKTRFKAKIFLEVWEKLLRNLRDPYARPQMEKRGEEG